MISDGYEDDYKVTERGMESLKKGKVYQPEQVQVINFFRFEGMSDPDDNAILYVIETNDGGKGTLIDGYGIYTEPRIATFMKEVDNIQKKVVKS
jgi:hypothetical protein